MHHTKPSSQASQRDLTNSAGQLILLTTLFLGACSGTPPAKPTPSSAPSEAPPKTTESPPGPSADPAVSQRWELAEALLVIHVGKTGRLARFGHNHLVTSSAVTGTIDLTRSRLSGNLSLPVTSLEVDSPAQRARYRAKNPDWARIYQSTPGPKAIADTTANMLGPKVLDAVEHPMLQVQVAGAAEDLATIVATGEPTAGTLPVQLEISLKGHLSNHATTLRWATQSDGTLHWSGSFNTTHQQLGLEPFTALGGALGVADALSLDLSGVLVRSGSVQTGPPSVGRARTETIRSPPQ